MRTVRGQVLLLASLLLSTAGHPALSRESQGASSSAKIQNPSQEKQEAKSGASEYDEFLRDIDNDKDAETRLERYLGLANNPKAPAAARKAALEKWQLLFARKMEAAAILQSARLSEPRSPQEWESRETSFQKALTLFPAPELRIAFGKFLLQRASYETRKGNLSAAAILVGRAQELGVDENSLKGVREELRRRETEWDGELWAGIKRRWAAIWSGVKAILGSPHVWGLVGIVFAIWLYRKLRGNRKDYQFEPFIVVLQHDADTKDKIYPGLTARLLKEMRRVAEIHQGSSQKALDEISDPLGNSVPINCTEYEPELTSKIEQIPEISVGAVKLPLISYLAILLRVNVKRVRTYYEEYSKGTKTFLRLIADMRGIPLAVQMEYAEPKPDMVPTAEQVAVQQFLEHTFPAGSQAQPVQADNGPELPSKEDALESLITKLACEIRFTRIGEENPKKAKRPEESYSSSAGAYREFTLGLDAQHNAAQILHGANPAPEQMEKARHEIAAAHQHYSCVIAMQGDHAAAYFCRAGISLQEAQLDKKLKTYTPDTPRTPQEFDRAPTRTRIDDAIDDYRSAVRLGRPHLRGLSYFNLANIFYRIHRCDAYAQALQYADQAETAFELAMPYSRIEATESLRRVWLLKVSILSDQTRACTLDPKRGTPEREIEELLARYERERPDQEISEYWRIKAKVDLKKVWQCLTARKEGSWDKDTESHCFRLLRDAEKEANRAVELDPEAAENYSTSATVSFARGMNLQNEMKQGTAEYDQCLRDMLAAYDRACELSTHEFYFYNRAIARDQFSPGEAGKIAQDYIRACATIANGQRSTPALSDYGDFLQQHGKRRLAAMFKALAGTDSAFNAE